MAGKRKTVMFVGGSLMPFCRFRRALIERLVRDHDCRVICAYWGDRADGFFAPFDLEGVVWQDLGGDHASPPGIADLPPLARLFRTIRRHRPDVICCFNAKPIALGPRIARLARPGARIVALMEGLGSALSFLLDASGPKRPVFRTLTRPVDRWVLLNDRDAGVILDLHPQQRESISTLPGIGIDPDHFSPGPDLLAQRRLIFVGRLVPEKGIDMFLALARHLRGSDWRLAAAGLPTPHGIAPAEIENWLREGLLESCAPVHDMAAFYRRASVLVFPSRYEEGLPAVIMEAQASGLPCLVRDTPVLRGTIRHGETGFLVSGEDPSDWAAALKRLEEPATFAAFSAAARRHAVEQFDQDRINARLIGLLLQA
ncbi:glycosyltransferase [Paracoccus denitrificans]|uniref:glycosyltransferase n=1 Tax=Paracoccus denitrificans TaxID=266 RepID=UPI001F285414|nr:glycosyltransferase [Paracoccus denitrificans]